MARPVAMPPRLAAVADSPAFAGTAWPSLLLDRRGVVQAVNDAYLLLAGCSRRELLGAELATALRGAPGPGEGADAGEAAAHGWAVLAASAARVVHDGRPHALPPVSFLLPPDRPDGPWRSHWWAVEHLPVQAGDHVVGVWQHAEDVTASMRLVDPGRRQGAPSARLAGEVGTLVRQMVRVGEERDALVADNRRLGAALATMVGTRQRASASRMDAYRRRQLWGMVMRRSVGHRWHGWADAVAQVAVDALPAVAGCAVTLGSGALRHVLAASDAWAEYLQAVEDTVGEGPGTEATATAAPVAAGTLAEVALRWPGFRQAIGDTGLTGAAGFPLMAPTGAVGSVVVYHRGDRTLSPTARRDAVLLADLASTVVLHDLDGFARILESDDPIGAPVAGAPDQSAADAPVDGDPTRAWSVTAPGTPGTGWDDGTGSTATATQVGRAVGLVAAELGISIDQALSVLRGRAFAEGQLLGALADDVVARRVRFAPGDDDAGSGDGRVRGLAPPQADDRGEPGTG